MNELQIFNNAEFGEVRVAEINGEPWFVGKDVAIILGYQNASKALIDHVDEEDKLNNESLSSLGQRGGWLINESGLYSLILSSNLPSAKRFRRWVTADVLPSIRKHGLYAVDDLIQNPDLAIKALQALKEEREKTARLQADNDRMRPKEIFADAVTASDSSILVRELAKMLRQNGKEYGEKRLYKRMRADGFICQGSTEPTQRAMEMGLFERIVRTVQRGDGLPLETVTTKVTGKGQQFFINKYLKF